MTTIAWPQLTRIPAKGDLYARETYFREGLADAEKAFGDADLAAGLRSSALLMLKPDGLASGRLAPVLDYLAEHDYTVAGVRELNFSRFHWRELWRYQLTSATLDRLAVNECLLGAGPALLLVLRSGEGHDLPATVRLSTLKGSATLSEQRPGTLRALLGQPNRVLSYIHVADEPADLVRELGLLFDGEARPDLFADLARGSLSAQDKDLLDASLERFPSPGRSLAPEEALDRVAAALAAAEPGPVTQAALDRVARMRRGERVEWRPFLDELRTLRIRPERWDLAVLGTFFITYDEPGHVKVLTGPDPESWKRENA